MHRDEYTFIHIHTLTYKYCYPYLKCSITVCPCILPRWLNTLRPRQYGRYYTDDIFKWIFLRRMYGFRLKFHWNLILVAAIHIFPAQAMLWCRLGDKPLSELMMVRLLTHICIAQPQWVKYMYTHTYAYKCEHISIHAHISISAYRWIYLHIHTYSR